MDDRSGGPVPQLPDFSGGSRGAGGSGESGGTGGPGTPGGFGRGPGGHPPQDRDPSRPGGRGRGPLLAVVLGTAGCLVVVLAVVALVLSQTVFRGAEEDPTGAETTAAEEDPAQDPEEEPSEYVPTEEQTDEAGEEEITLAEQPTVDCTVHDNEVTTEQTEGAVRGGGLEFTPAESWDVGTNWGGSSSYTVDQSFAHQPVENGWYSVAGVGAVDFPEDEGGYPGGQEAARAIFQCALSRDDVQELYGDPVELVDYHESKTTIDGHPAWFVGADAQLDDAALFHTTDAWRLVVIVVDTPDGPAVFNGGAALGHDQQVLDLESMIESLHVL